MKIPRKRFSDEIAQAIQLKITEMGLKEGDRLPSHANMAKELNVSIPSLREGIQVLTTLGLLKIDHGKGTTVTSPKVSDYFRILDPVLMSTNRSKEEYLEIIRILGSYIISNTEVSEKNLYSQKRIIGKMKDAAEGDNVGLFIDENREFYHNLSLLTGNSVIAEILDIINSILFSDIEVKNSIKQNMQIFIGINENLIQALKNQDRESASGFIENYIFQIGHSSTQSTVNYTLCTGSIGGSYYTIGSEICRFLNKNGGISIKAEPTGGGIENVNLTGWTRDLLSLTQSDVAFHAYNGENNFTEPHSNIRAICGTHYLNLWVVTRKDSNIKSVTDFRDKRIAMGSIGGESSIVAKSVLETFGYKNGDYRPSYLSISNAIQGMKNSEIDVIFYLTNGPGSALSELSNNLDIEILGFDSTQMDLILKKNPFWIESTINKGRLKGIKEDIQTLSIATILIAHKDLPNKLVRNITELIMEQADEINQEFDDTTVINIDTALKDVTIPFHPGAEEYFREKGVIRD